MTIVTVEVAARDERIAADLGTVVWIGARTCEITTDNEAALMIALGRNENVVDVECVEVC